ncbi:hypothetical protein AUEXF2481DRAFT_92998 [Aureobasidium subglaciale EXF-2481]|uniref:Uncharacterized protein n=1 Tax=Aureobasidium subglaciale (strain EXF-2481) TaxID=1043005 RepID=A0A074YU49_AURSE|nr:uncharacterized protein AUEXF2481DRAFT_92998 [Aureobasidium subglaciale EXF-2481]KAI5195586.1 hypothetical protein E4T38_09004 [Aureobasidium subglaciale]KAI5214529.1 hypothetical protein E4T40_08964 [Aureobasidium subglaciale]KAI5217265.1 hypothetical protein E4T41_08923 [Aureobasidium subglaciale]KAI5255017.1 hypothetical protein E4T46_08957 [Aureobasidium subglaciale]KEQ90381.1 hypothetical protein AUEXF2481DRAFT_92998 [Aureobasidium subglaciale EXF-2481]
MRPSTLFVLLSILNSLVGASKGAKGYQTVGIYYAYSLEWLAKNKDPTYVHTLAAPCYKGKDCSTFAKFLQAVVTGIQLERAKQDGILNSGGPFDNNNPGDEAAKAFNQNSALTGQFDNEKMYGDKSTTVPFSSMAEKVADATDRARISLGSEGQDIVDKIAYYFEEVVKVRKIELSPDKVTDIKKSNPNIDFRTKVVDDLIEIDWEATYQANPDLKEGQRTARDLVKKYQKFEPETKPAHLAVIDIATSLVNRLRSPPCA